MNRRPVPVTLPRAHFDVDPDGHLTVTVDGRPWQPPSDDPTRPTLGTVRLGRSDLLWARQQIANELGAPVRVETADRGQTLIDIVLPDGYQVADPGSPQMADEAGPGPYRPGEPVSISVVVGHTHADEHGHVHYRLPAALGDRAVLVHGEASGASLPLDQASLPQRETGAGTTPTRPASQTRDYNLGRHQSGPGHPPQPVEPAPEPRVTADDGLGAL